MEMGASVLQGCVLTQRRMSLFTKTKFGLMVVFFLDFLHCGD